ncbi:MAG: SMC-Scp complex subunit ScpB [Planctomycetota bacterium]
MDDISREPLPGGRRSGQPGMRGPVEVVHLEALSVDETPNDDPATRDELRAATDDDRGLGEDPDSQIPDSRLPESETDEAELSDESGVVDDLVEKAERRRTDSAGEPELEAATGLESEEDGTPDLPTELQPDESIDADELVPEADASSSEPEPADPDDEELEVPKLKDPVELGRVLMGVLLVSREPVTRMRLAEVANSTTKLVDQALEALESQLREAGIPLEVVRAGDRVRVMTTSALHPYVRRLKRQKRVERLSPAALETLAVVAYKQPVIRAEIEAIRGVKVGPMLKSLLDHRLCKVVGRADVPGRPLQYGTTELFLERFGLQSLKELPSLDEFRAAN